MSESILVTGAAGFIGSHIAERLLNRGDKVTGLDNFDEYYSADIKRANIEELVNQDSFHMVQGDIRDNDLLARLFAEDRFDVVIHLAARAGVRPSLQYPGLYQEVNIGGTINLLEASRRHAVRRFVFASSSSVYGGNTPVPFNEDARIESTASPYAASKAAGELYCRTYSHLYNLPITTLRFFTVYGPRQRPEMAIHLFTRMIDTGKEITIFGDGSSKRDYTYIGDVADGIIQAVDSRLPRFEVFNLGNSQPIALEYLVQLIEESLGKKAKVKNMPMQPGDVPITFADITKSRAFLGYKPIVPIEEGVASFVAWYQKKAHPAKFSLV